MFYTNSTMYSEAVKWRVWENPKRCEFVSLCRLDLFLFFNTNINHGEDRGFFAPRQLRQIVGQNLQFMEGVVRVIRLGIALFD